MSLPTSWINLLMTVDDIGMFPYDTCAYQKEWFLSTGFVQPIDVNNDVVKHLLSITDVELDFSQTYRLTEKGHDLLRFCKGQPSKNVFEVFASSCGFTIHAKPATEVQTCL